MIYALRFSFSGEVTLSGSASAHSRTHSREDALSRFNDFCSSLSEDAFLGVTEGILLAEEAHERGYETESWVLDAGEAPHERDWLSQEKNLDLIAYFKTEKAAQAGRAWLMQEYVFRKAPQVLAEEEQDWNATWKASFTGIEVTDELRVLPPWHEEWLALAKKPANDRKGPKGQMIVAINPGAGFGTGTHETTQLCLKILLQLSDANGGNLKGKTVLDFGSGSGILGITAALFGASVYCVEIDKMANDNARDNAKFNEVENRIQILERIPDSIRGGKVDILIANILRPILLQFAGEIKDCLKSNAELVLSGLIESDLDQVIRTYQTPSSGEPSAPFDIQRSEKNEWRALWLRRHS